MQISGSHQMCMSVGQETSKVRSQVDLWSKTKVWREIGHADKFVWFQGDWQADQSWEEKVAWRRIWLMRMLLEKREEDLLDNVVSKILDII